MCELCDKSGPAAAQNLRRRRRLWELSSGLHCSIVGTCLTLGDLHRIARKLRLKFAEGAEEYDVHGQFVLGAGSAGPIAKAMQKTLDRKYEAAIRRFGRFKDEEDLRRLWARCLDDGEVPGPYWALLTHPHVTDRLSLHAYGTVHMLSHLVGASNRADIRRLRDLEKERDILTDQVAKAKRKLAERDREARDLVEQYAEELRELEARLDSAQSRGFQLKTAEARICELENGEAYRDAQSQLAALGQRTNEEAEKAETLMARVVALTREVDDLRNANTGLRKTVDSITQECEALETVLRSDFPTTGETPCRSIDLYGQRIIYVGGRTGADPTHEKPGRARERHLHPP